MRKLTVLIVILQMFSCVSMKKFASTNVLLTNMKRDSIATAKVLGAQNERIDELLRRNISLGRDTLRLFNDYFNLLEKYERTVEDNRQQIARVNSQLRGSSKRASYTQGNGRISRVASALTKSISSFGDEISATLRQYNRSLYSVENKNWELVITLRDSLLYIPIEENGHVEYDRSRLTRAGELLMNKIASIIVEKDNFDVTVREYVYINSPQVKNMPQARIEDLSLANKKILESVIDTLMVRGVMVINTSAQKQNEIMAQNRGVLDMQQSLRLDSINATREAERLRREEIERLSEYNRQKERAHRQAIDRTTIIMKTLLKYSYHNMGSSKLSRDVSYVKSNRNGNNECDWIEIILKPGIGELYQVIKEVEKR